ncbi:tagaturonate epimerase family protein [Rhodohalobacter sp. 8-1]|uniref:tagaturonate epimerase family protein n=1 Tax=Rhodohalobacter sp. 8-1 TaxID=3131972 RepID=UPI0030ED7CE4
MLGKYSLGTGDRFGQQGQAQLQAVLKAKINDGVTIYPVWNKSHREHEIIGTNHNEVRREADSATSALGWRDPYFVDADHITLDIVDPYIQLSNFFTIDVADFIGEPADESDKEEFLRQNRSLIGEVSIPGISESFKVSQELLDEWCDQYLHAIKEAGRLYRYIKQKKSNGEALFEISMDEVETPQTPVELFFILRALSDYDVMINTIAPKFTGEFYKGVDYVGEIDQFIKEFDEDLWVIDYAVREFKLPENLKLSVHSGSDKFSLYPEIRKLILKHDTGLHLKTSGTTWLEELIGLAESGEDGLNMVHKIYKNAYGRYDELTGPYLPVIDIEKSQLPQPDEFSSWTGRQIKEAVEHNPDHPKFQSGLRQFFHCSYKIAAEEGDAFIDLLDENRENISSRVTHNLYARHIQPLFVG